MRLRNIVLTLLLPEGRIQADPQTARTSMRTNCPKLSGAGDSPHLLDFPRVPRGAPYFPAGKGRPARGRRAVRESRERWLVKN